MKEAFALFGGAFDPPHLGHLAAAHDALEAFSAKGQYGFQDILQVSELVFLPSGRSPFKYQLHFSAEKRIQWLNAMIETQKRDYPSEISYERMLVSNEEISIASQTQAPNYTSDTLARWRAKYSPKPPLFILGSDQLADLPRWNRFPLLLTLSHWVVLERKEKMESLRQGLKSLLESNLIKPVKEGVFTVTGSTPQPKFLFILPTHAPAISSTQIREALALGKPEGWQPYFPKALWSDLEKTASCVKA